MDMLVSADVVEPDTVDLSATAARERGSRVSFDHNVSAVVHPSSNRVQEDLKQQLKSEQSTLLRVRKQLKLREMEVAALKASEAQLQKEVVSLRSLLPSGTISSKFIHDALPPVNNKNPHEVSS